MSFELRCKYCGGRSVACDWCKKLHEERCKPPPPIDYTVVEPEIDVSDRKVLRLTHQPNARRVQLRLAAVNGRQL